MEKIEPDHYGNLIGALAVTKHYGRPLFIIINQKLNKNNQHYILLRNVKTGRDHGTEADSFMEYYGNNLIYLNSDQSPSTVSHQGELNQG